MKNVIDIRHLRPQQGPSVSTGQLANILDKALGCLEPGYESKILETLLGKCTTVLDSNGLEADKRAVLEEAKYSLYNHEIGGGALHIQFHEGPSFELRSAFFLDPELSREISIALDLEIELNAGKRKRAALALQEAACVD